MGMMIDAFMMEPDLLSDSTKILRWMRRRVNPEYMPDQPASPQRRLSPVRPGSLPARRFVDVQQYAEPAATLGSEVGCCGLS